MNIRHVRKRVEKGTRGNPETVTQIVNAVGENNRAALANQMNALMQECGYEHASTASERGRIVLTYKRVANDSAPVRKSLPRRGSVADKRTSLKELRDALEEYRDHLRDAGLAEDTISEYSDRAERFLSWFSEQDP